MGDGTSEAQNELDSEQENTPETASTVTQLLFGYDEFQSGINVDNQSERNASSTEPFLGFSNSTHSSVASTSHNLNPLNNQTPQVNDNEANTVPLHESPTISTRPDRDRRNLVNLPSSRATRRMVGIYLFYSPISSAFFWSLEFSKYFDLIYTNYN